MSKRELEALRAEVEELRKFKKEWEKAFPGLTPEGVKSMEKQLYIEYKKNDKDVDKKLSTDYQENIDSSLNE